MLVGRLGVMRPSMSSGTGPRERITSTSTSTSTTQQSARRPVDEMNVFQKKVLSPRPEATVQVYFNANTHILKLRCKNGVLA